MAYGTDELRRPRLLVPHREQDAVGADGEQAGQVDGISAAQRIASGKITACTATASVSSTARVAAQNSAQAASARRSSTGSRRPARPLFGSWAARYRGEPGPAPKDDDVLLIGEIDREDAYEAGRRAEDRLGFSVNPTLLTARRWNSGDDPLTRTIKSSALVEVLPTALDPAR